MENTNFKALRTFRVYFIPIYIVITLVFLIGVVCLAYIHVIRVRANDLISNVCSCMVACGVLMVMAQFFISFKDIKFDQGFIKINLEKIKYSAFSSVHSSKYHVLSLRSDAQKIIIEATLILHNKDQIKQIIEEFEKRNKTVIDERSQSTKERTKFYTEDILPIIGIGVLFGVLGLFYLLEGGEKEIIVLLWCALTVLYSIYGTYKGGISINDKSIRIQGNDFIPRYVLLSDVARARIGEDNNLIFYDTSNKAENSFDLDKMRDNDVQEFINVLCKKIPISIDPQIAVVKNYILPEYALKEAPRIANRRRYVAGTAEMQPAKEVNRITQDMVNIEPDSQSATGNNKGRNRRLEL